MKSTPPIRTQRGFSLNEAMISLTVVTSGLLTLAQFQGQAYENSHATRARTIAINLSSEKLEALRTQAATDFAGIRDGQDTPTLSAREDTTFNRRWTVTTHPDSELKEVAVVTDWRSPDGANRSTGMTSLITSSTPYAADATHLTQARLAEQTPANADEPAVDESVAQTEIPQESPPHKTATCLCVRGGSEGQATVDPRSSDADCSSACCEARWTTFTDGACADAGCTFVASCP